MNDLELEISRFSPGEIDPTDRAEAWAEHVTNLQGEFTFHFDRGTRSFTGSSLVQHWGAQVVGRFSSTAMRYTRSARKASSDGDAGIRLIVPVRGHLGLSTGSDEIVDLVPGSVGLFPMDRAMMLEYGDRIVAVMATIPEDTLPSRLVSKIPPMLGRDRPMATLLASHVEKLNSLQGTMTPRQFMQSTELMFQHLTYILEEKREEDLVSAPPLTRRIHDAAVAGASDPDFSQATLAAVCGCSISSLYKALGDVTPADLLRTIRLENAFAFLRNDKRFPTISDVAIASGFNSLATFHRAFVKKYRTTPGDVREQYLSGGAVELNGVSSGMSQPSQSRQS